MGRYEAIIYLIFAYGLDFWLGDPLNWPHPVILMGNYIQWYEKQTRFKQQSQNKQYWLGLGLWTSLLGGTITFVTLTILLAQKIHPILGHLLSVYYLYTSFSTKSLATEAEQVHDRLVNDSLATARMQVGRIVGRETSELSQEQIIAATVETVAENTSDGFVAPLFFAVLFGPVGAMAYKAVNTLDSMVGYLNPTYQYFGRVSALLDDVFNLIPARITGLLFVLASRVLELSTANSWQILKRDRRAHKSPNGGYPEAAVAGALGVQLGGSHYYHGQLSVKPTIGDATRPLQADDILLTNRLMYCVTAMAIILSLVVLFIFPQLPWLLVKESL